LEFGKYYDFCVVNEDVERAGREAQAIVTALRCTSARRRARVEQLLASLGGNDGHDYADKAPESQFAYVVLARGVRGRSWRVRRADRNPRTLKATRIACEELEHS